VIKIYDDDDVVVVVLSMCPVSFFLSV